MTLQVVSGSRWLDNSDVYPLIEGYDVTPAGVYDVTVRTASSSVYIGGDQMPIGSDFVDVDSEHAQLGYLLNANQEYRFEAITFSSPSIGLFATTTDADGAAISVLALPRLHG